MTAPARLSGVAKGLGALAATAVIVVGVPAGLWTQIGWPLPSALPTWPQLLTGLRAGQVSDQMLIDALAIVCWLAWGQLVIALAAETIAALRGQRGVRRLPVARPLQAAAAKLITAIALLGALTGPRAALAVPLPNLGLAVPAAAHLDVPAAGEGPAVQPATPARYTVQARDDLWSLAERHLGDPYRWPEIYALNQARPQPDGGALDDPDLLHPGWTLEFPADAVGLPTPPASQADPAARPEPAGSQPPHAPAAPAAPGRQANPPLATPDSRAHLTPPLAPPPTGHGDGSSAPTAGESGDPVTAPSASSPEPSRDGGHGWLDPHHPAPGNRYWQVPAPGERPSNTGPTAPSNHRRSAPSGASGQRSSPSAESRTPRVVAPIELPSGSVVGATVAAGIAAALAAARLHSRRRHQPARPQPGINHAEPLVTYTVRRLRRAVTASSEGGFAESAAGRPPAGMVTAVQADEQQVLVDLTAHGGLILAGPGAEAAARGLLVDLLASTAPGMAHVQLADPVGRLIPDAELPPGLDLVGLSDAVQQLEVEVLARTRLLDTADQPDWRAFVAANPADPVPALLLVATDPDRTLLRRLDTVAGLGRSLGLGTLLLDRDLNGTTPCVTVDASGTVTSTEPSGQLADLVAARLPTLSVQEAVDLLAVLAAGQDASPEDQPDRRDQPVEAEPFPIEAPSEGRAISVTLFGPYEIEAGGAPIRTGLRNKARELLALLLLHPRGITLEQATAALWPDAEPDRGTERFRTVLGNLRSRLRANADLPAAAIVDHLGSQRYQADAHLFDCDLWRFQHALTRAAAATDPEEQIPALQAAAAAYTGDLLDGALYEWVEPAREDLRRRAIDTLAHLATLHQQRGDTAAALTALDQAITRDPYAEAVYQRVIRLQTDTGQPDAARRTYRLLEAHLAELDAEPAPATTALLTSLLAATGPERSR